MPPCPIPVHSQVTEVMYHLWDHSPSKGILPTRLDGDVKLVQGSTGKTLVEFSVVAFVK